jgi:hypothetical protein
MYKTVRAAAVALACFAASLAFGQSGAGRQDEGMVQVKSKNLDQVWLLPGADFRPYKKILLKHAEVAFQKDWLRDMNGSNSIDKLGARVSNAQAAQVVEAARKGVDGIWAEAFTKEGFQVVTAPGEGVLEIAPRIVDLYVNAVDRPGSGGISRSYTVQAGEATLKMEVRDSVTGTLMGRVADHRQTVRNTNVRSTTSNSNVEDFARLFAVWAVITVKGLEELQANSPVPQDLKPGQKLKSK